MGQPAYCAFISYSHRDSRWAAWLHKVIESYRPPRKIVGTKHARDVIPKRMAPVFRDRDELATATDLGTEITAALERSGCQIVICSPHAAKSKWVNEEILSFKRLGREDRIFCLIVDGEPNASDLPDGAEQECFPPALRYRLGPDGKLSDVRSEPIAADARPGKDGRQNAKLKLIAGVLGVGFDTLKRREQQRRNRRLVAIACVAIAGMVVTSGLAAFAFIQKRTADRQRVRAERAAETANQTTDFLVDLFRISDPGEARGDAVTAREMLDKGAARIKRQLVKQPAVRATLMDTLGTVYMGLGLYHSAKPLLDAALETRRGLPDVSPLAMSRSFEHEGELMRMQANYGAAERDFRGAIAVLPPDRRDRRSEEQLADTLQSFGELLEDEGKYREADRRLRLALDLQRKLYGPSNPAAAYTLKELARVMSDEGDLNGAIGTMRAALAMERSVWGTKPYPDVAEALNDLGSLLEEHGNYNQAESLLTQSIAMKRRLYGDAHPEIAAGLDNLAAIMDIKGDHVHAEATYREALAMQRKLVGPVNPDVATTLNNLAFVQSERGHLHRALATESEALAILRKLFPGDNPDVATIMNRIGFWQIEARQYRAAKTDLETALAMRRRLNAPNRLDVATSLVNVAILQIAEHHFEAALESSRQAVTVLSAALSPDHWKTAVAESAEGAALAGLGRYAAAQRHLTHGVGILEKNPAAPPDYRRLAVSYLNRLNARTAMKRSRAGTARRIPLADAPTATRERRDRRDRRDRR